MIEQTHDGDPRRPEDLISREKRVMQILDQTGAILSGHFQYTSGLHGDAYINKDAIYAHPKEAYELASMIAEDFKDSEIEAVVGSAMGGIILANNIALALAQLTGRDISGIYAEKSKDKGFIFTRGYNEFVNGRKVLVVDDILSTGGSARAVVETVNNAGGEIIGVAAIANRGGVKSEDVQANLLVSLIDIQMTTVPQEECSQCADGIPVNVYLGSAKSTSS